MTTAYTVESKEELRQLDKAFKPITIWRIWATSKGGTYFHILVPEDQLDKAEALLAAKAQQLDAIK